MARARAFYTPDLQERLRVHKEEENKRTQELLESWEEPNTLVERDSDGYTRLHLAMLNKLEGLADEILKEVKDPNYLDAVNCYGQSALHIAASAKRASLVRKLVISGARIHIWDRLGNTPLHFACKFGALECVQALINSVTNDEKRLYGENRATAWRTWVDLKWVNCDGDSCLRLAARGQVGVLRHPQSLEIIEFLILRGADINETHRMNGKTLLHLAVEHDDMAFVKLLLALGGVNLNIADHSGYTPVTIASARGNRSMVSYLVTQGADTSAGKTWLEVLEEDARANDGSDESEEGSMVTVLEMESLTL